MKEHFCSVEKSMITYQGKCNWCGEQEALAQMQEPDVQETLHWHAFNYRQAHTAQAHEMWQQLEQFVDSKIKAPQRTWVGLTDEERFEIDHLALSRVQAVQMTEAKLKELNT
jgi:hypothetical protein